MRANGKFQGGSSSVAEKKSIFELARVLVILGAILTLLGGVFQVAAPLTERRLPPLDSLVSNVGYGILVIVLGLVALIAVRNVKLVIWDIVLIVIGVVAYRFGEGFPWYWGPILIILGGIVGIIGRLV